MKKLIEDKIDNFLRLLPYIDGTLLDKIEAELETLNYKSEYKFLMTGTMLEYEFFYYGKLIRIKRMFNGDIHYLTKTYISKKEIDEVDKELSSVFNKYLKDLDTELLLELYEELRKVKQFTYNNKDVRGIVDIEEIIMFNNKLMFKINHDLAGAAVPISNILEDVKNKTVELIYE